MARRSDHSRDELYELILKTASEIVERDGYRALTVRNIADAIGYSPGTLYNLFVNLDDLIVHLNAGTLDRLQDQLAREQMTGNPEDDLEMMLTVYLNFLETHRELWNLLFEYSLPEGELTPLWYQKKIDNALGLVEAVIAPIFEDKESEECKKAARVLWAALHGICSLSTSGKLMVVGEQGASDMARSLVINYLAGLRMQVSAQENKEAEPHVS